MSAQTLRSYEAHGLLEPDRTAGGTRRYSANDLDRVCRIADLLDAGLNLAGIAMVLDLECQNSQLCAEKEEQQWLSTASIRRPRHPKPTSSTAPPQHAAAAEHDDLRRAARAQVHARPPT